MRLVFCGGSQGLVPAARSQLYRGGLSSPASQPTASLFMGSTAIATFSVRPQVVHSKVRSSNPREPGVMRAKAILCLQTGHIGRSFGELIRLPQRWMSILYAGSGAAFNHDRNGTVAGELVERAVRKCRPAWPRLQAPDPQRRGRAQASRFAGANDDEFLPPAGEGSVGAGAAYPQRLGPAALAADRPRLVGSPAQTAPE